MDELTDGVKDGRTDEPKSDLQSFANALKTFKIILNVIKQRKMPFKQCDGPTDRLSDQPKRKVAYRVA